ncbi:MAG TPA: hypothetical protein ENJ18_15845, partial [Nannocystis exedens]|nr:hypothetical protein [Nannocystis exedens]
MAVFVLACVLLALSGCYDSSGWEDLLAQQNSSSSSSSSDTLGGTGTVTITTAGLTDDSGSASGGETMTGTDSDTGIEGSGGGGPWEPAILDVTLSPNPIYFNGAVAVEVRVQNTDAVEMDLDGGGDDDVQTLVEVEAGVFVGEIAVYTGLEPGEHSITLTPWNGDEEGQSVQTTYTQSLPDPGSEGLWQTGDIDPGSGEVAAVDVLPSGEILDFGSSTKGGESRCYLRRRDPGGSWGAKDLLDVLPGKDCEAIDVDSGDDGKIYLLMRRKNENGWVWWLAEMPTWDASLVSRIYGNKDEVANALAERAGTLAVCGALPTSSPDDLTDAMVRIVRPGKSGLSQSWDYKQKNDHDESARGCVFVDDVTLVIVGEVFGEFYPKKQSRNRRFAIFYSLTTNQGELAVAAADSKTQSAASDVVIDASGRIVITGYSCDDICIPNGQLWWLDAKGQAVATAELGTHASSLHAPQALYASPADYVVVASGGLADDPSAFLVRAYAFDSGGPLWTYSRTDAGQFSLARCVA